MKTIIFVASGLIVPVLFLREGELQDHVHAEVVLAVLLSLFYFYIALTSRWMFRRIKEKTGNKYGDSKLVWFIFIIAYVVVAVAAEQSLTALNAPKILTNNIVLLILGVLIGPVTDSKSEN